MKDDSNEFTELLRLYGIFNVALRRCKQAKSKRQQEIALRELVRLGVKISQLANHIIKEQAKTRLNLIHTLTAMLRDTNELFHSRALAKFSD